MKCLTASVATFFLALSSLWASPEQIPEGYYHFDGAWIYKGLCHISHRKGDLHQLQCLDGRKYAFSISAKRNNSVKLGKSAVPLGKIRRTMSGSGTLSKPGHAAGKGSVWTKTLGFFGRDHRKGPWTLRSATREEAASGAKKRAELKKEQNIPQQK